MDWLWAYSFVPIDPISKLLEMGYTNIFETVIQSINPAAQPESQVGVIVYLIPRTKNP
jgi:hypothetical protein